MRDGLVNTYNTVFQEDLSEYQALAYLRGMADKFFPMPEHCDGQSWWHHVPVNLLLAWRELSDDARLALAVMGQSFTKWDIPGLTSPKPVGVPAGK